MFGGGGYFGVKVSAAKGIDRLAASLEFGASMSVNLGVAKGSICAMGGVYFRLENGDAHLSAYLRLHGGVEVLSILSITVDLMLALEYEPETNRLIGKARISVRVKLLFLCKTVSVEFEQTLAGGNSDPTFAELMAPEGVDGPPPWDLYCTAFAEGATA
jgi:hypothetical protein